MTLISALFIIAGRFFVKIFITVFGWAVVIFYGRIPEEKSRLFFLLSVLSLVWIILIGGLLYPALVKPFYDYIPYHNMKKIISMILESLGVLIIPVIVGELAVFIKGKEKATYKAYFKATFVGYMYSFLMGIAMALMLLFAPLITAKRAVMRYKSLHIPVVIPTGDTNAVIKKISASLEKKGILITIKRTSILYRLPVIIIRKIIRQILGLEIDGRQNKMIKGKDFRIFINPTDIMIEGEKVMIEWLRCRIVMELIYDEAYLTYSEEAQQMEKGGLSVYKGYERGLYTEKEAAAVLEDMKEKAEYTIDNYEEWEMIVFGLLWFENKILKKDRKKC